MPTYYCQEYNTCDERCVAVYGRGRKSAASQTLSMIHGVCALENALKPYSMSATLQSPEFVFKLQPLTIVGRQFPYKPWYLLVCVCMVILFILLYEKKSGPGRTFPLHKQTLTHTRPETIENLFIFAPQNGHKTYKQPKTLSVRQLPE